MNRNNTDTNNLISSAVATVFAEGLTMPICTIKTNYQTNLAHKSILDAYSYIKNSRGYYGFYNSSVIGMASQIISTASKFTFYNMIKRFRNTKEDDLKNNIVNGSVGGVMASFFTHPLDFAKVYRQNNLSISNELKNNGLKIFYRGYSKTLSKNVMLTSFLFPFYDFYQTKFNNNIISSVLSSVSMSIILQPFDLLKIRQISNQQLYPTQKGLGNSIKYFYRGFHINLMRIIPHFTITMYLTNKIKTYLS